MASNVLQVEVLEDYINCTICLNVMTKTITTSCCHRFCEKCIKEWVDRNSKCPCCNSTLNSKHLYSDRQYDSLIECIVKEKARLQEAYFQKVCSSASNNEACDGSNPITDSSCIENVLKKHLQKSLIEHGSYFQSLKTEFDLKKKSYEAKIRTSKDELMSKHACQSDLKEIIAKLEKNVVELQKEFENCQKLVAEAYDRYLTEHIPNLHILPISVSIYIIDKDLRLPDVILKPDSRLNEVQGVIKKILLERHHDEITEWTDEPVYIFSPLAKRSLGSVEYKKIIEEMKCGKEITGVSITSWTDRPVLTCQMKPGSEIVLYNCMKLDSDYPVCYIHKHQPGSSNTVDYYKCQDCGFNWICKSCIKFCHKGHATSVHVLQNKPTWACCYCPKKKKCLME
ncbi:tripartite motif-containing protein 5 [Patella vulgata]|uniref:tripartite motif-containing protein 5 n=1 Tax=Patella vulgata TaxID=6465 RepID=UPI0024A9B2D7|nr:tripartite motif-containing protein 5 [Patella vulgata]